MIADEFADGNWICPDIDQFQILNDPWLYKFSNGTNFVMVVNTCQDAKVNDKDHNLQTYADD